MTYGALGIGSACSLAAAFILRNGRMSMVRLGITSIAAGRSGGRNEKAPIGIEPMHKGFADLSLTSWVRRPAVPWPALGAERQQSIPNVADAALFVHMLTLAVWGKPC